MSLQVGTRGQEILESGKEVSRRERAGASRLGEARRLPKRVGGGSRGRVGGDRHPPHARGDRRPPTARDLRPSACVTSSAPSTASGSQRRVSADSTSPGGRPGPCGARFVLLVAPPRPRRPSRPQPRPSDRHRRRAKRGCAAHGECAGHAPLGTMIHRRGGLRVSVIVAA